MVRVDNRQFEEIKDNSKFFFHCAYASVSMMSEQSDGRWGYALFDHEGHLLRIYGKPAFLKYCEESGILKGSVWSGEEAGFNAVAKGLADNASCVSAAHEHSAPELKAMNIYFSPVSLNTENIKYAFFRSPGRFSCTEAEKENSRIGLYGGIAILAVEDEKSPLYLPLAEATAREVNLQLFWHNAVSHDRIHNAGFISINQADGTNKIMIISSGVYEIFELPVKNYHLCPLEDVIDQLPENNELWTILKERRVVVDYPLDIVRGKKIIPVKLSTYRSREEKFRMLEFVLWIYGTKKNAGLPKSFGNVADIKFSDIIAEDGNFKKVLMNAEITSLSDCNVLLQGESGSGKDLIAQAIHNASSRKDHPFVVVNCASFSKELISSELFGYTAGAFTGANKTGAIGKFQLADKGTLFLDEIGDMPLDLQANLLRAIEQKSFMQVGGTQLVKVDVRVVAASNRNLKELIDEKLFRLDLYYRLGVVKLSIPPLRQRKKDIIPLARYFLSKFQLRYNHSAIALSPEVEDLLLDYSWPGNVRELQNMLEGIVSIVYGPVIEAEHVQAFLELEHSRVSDKTGGNKNAGTEYGAGQDLDGDSSKRKLALRLSTISRDDVVKALEANDNNCSKAAEELGISRRTLYRRLEQYKLLK